MSVSSGIPFRLFVGYWSGNIGTITIPSTTVLGNVVLVANTATPLSDLPVETVGTDGTGYSVLQRTSVYFSKGCTTPQLVGSFFQSKQANMTIEDLSGSFFLRTTLADDPFPHRWVQVQSAERFQQPIGMGRTVSGVTRFQEISNPNSSYFWGIGTNEDGINLAVQGLGNAVDMTVRSNLQYLGDGAGVQTIFTVPNVQFNISDVTGTATTPAAIAYRDFAERRIPFRISTLGHPASFWAGLDIGLQGNMSRSETFYPVHNMVTQLLAANIRTLCLPVQAAPFANGAITDQLYRVRTPLPFAAYQGDVNPWDLDGPTFSIRNRHPLTMGTTATTFYPMLALRKSVATPSTRTNSVRVLSVGALSGGTALRYGMGVRTVLSLGGNVGAWTPVANSVCEYNDLIGGDTTVATNVNHGTRAITEDVESFGSGCWRFPMGERDLTIDDATFGFANASIMVLGVYPTAGIADSYQGYINFKEVHG